MNKLKDIQINPFQLNRLLSTEELVGYTDLLNRGIYCTTCGGLCAKGVKVTEIHLNDMNNVMIQGTCKVCNGGVARIMELGENSAFFDKANEFRNELMD